MDFFKYDAPGSFDTMANVNAAMINGIKSARWTERYGDVGDFEFHAPLSSGLKDFLPPGTMVSHVATLELGIVENCEVHEPEDADPDVTITGRTFPSFLEFRAAGMHLARTAGLITEYTIPAQTLTLQIESLIDRHVGPSADANDQVIGLNVVSHGLYGPAEDRTIARGPLLQEVLKLLPLGDLGIRTIRRNPFGGLGSASETQLDIYKGGDKSDKVVYSSRTGHLASIDYLFSNKDNYSSALVMGRYVQVAYDTGLGITRRQLIIDGTDIDGHLDTAPSGLGLAMIQSLMTTRAQQILAKHHDINIARADVASTDPYEYRKDYSMGDLVTIAGNYGESVKMRVIEYVEIEDENGETGHPTFALPLS